MASDQNDRFKAGLSVRKDVLGPDYVNRALEQADEFNQPLQQLVTEYCWGTIWTRPGLDRKTRSLINLGMLGAMGKTHELGLHVKGAIRNGCTEQEIQEVLLQVCIYAGVPAGVEAFRRATEVLKEMRETASSSEQGTTSTRP